MHRYIFAALAFALTNISPAVADTTTTINPTSNWGTWEGWGTSLAWWGKRFGNRDDIANVLFTLNSEDISGTTLPGLGLTIVRYNAGASSWNTVDGSSMVVSANINSSRQMEGYWQDWFSTDPSSSSWNWTVDSNQRSAMSKARDRGANIFELFSNSPMWWMCKNHNPSGASDGSENIQSWNLDTHAVYMATIAKYAKDNWGITFQSVEPFNEPIASWWKADGTQEGCHINVGTQGTIINYLRSELNSRGLSSMIIAASDESYYDQAVSTFNSLDSSALANVTRINVHGYQYGSGRRDTLYSLASGKGKRLWNSEYGDGVASGNDLVSNLILDFRWLHPTAWVYWQALDFNGWGLINANNDNGVVGSATQKYFILAQFTRHIRAGMQILDGGSDNVVAAYDSGSKKLVIVAVNWGSAQYLNFNLSSFSQPGVNGAQVLRWSSQIGSGNQYVAFSNDTFLSSGRFWSWFETGMVQTFEVESVVL